MSDIYRQFILFGVVVGLVVGLVVLVTSNINTAEETATKNAESAALVLEGDHIDGKTVKNYDDRGITVIATDHLNNVIANVQNESDEALFEIVTQTYDAATGDLSSVTVKRVDRS